MLDLALAALVALAPGRLAPAVVPDRAEALHEAEDAGGGDLPDDAPEPDRKDPCSGREGWVGDGEDGRAPPACDGPEGDPAPEGEGLHAPDWLRRVEDDPEAADYER